MINIENVIAVAGVLALGGIITSWNNYKNEERKTRIKQLKKDSKKEVEKEEQKEITKGLLKITSIKKAYDKQYEQDVYIVNVKNISNKMLGEVVFRFGESFKNIFYYMRPGDTYQIKIYDEEADLNELNVLSVKYDYPYSGSNLVTINKTVKNGKVCGSIEDTDKSEEDFIFPVRMIFFFRNKENVRIQEEKGYYGTGLSKGQTLDFEEEIPEGCTLDKETLLLYSFNNESKNYSYECPNTCFMNEF